MRVGNAAGTLQRVYDGHEYFIELQGARSCRGMVSNRIILPTAEAASGSSCDDGNRFR